MSPTKALLIEAKRLIANPTQWTKGINFSVSLLETGEFLKSRCSVGAVLEAGRTLEIDPTLGIKALHEVTPPWTKSPFGLERWNDCPERTHEGVMEAFDKAIEAQP